MYPTVLLNITVGEVVPVRLIVKAIGVASKLSTVEVKVIILPAPPFALDAKVMRLVFKVTAPE